MAISSRKKQFFIVAALLLIALTAVLIYLNKEAEQDKPKTFEPRFRKEGVLFFIGRESRDTLSKIDIEIADDAYEVSTGLMYRKTMPDTVGMLFPFPKPAPRSFWMKNTYVSLDIIYVNERREIVSISKNTKPLSEESIPSGKNAQYVVEVIAGFSDRNHIDVGDRISFKRSK